MGDRPRRQQQHRRLAVAVDLVEDPHAVTLDVALLVRGAGTRLLAHLWLIVRPPRPARRRPDGPPGDRLPPVAVDTAAVAVAVLRRLPDGDHATARDRVRQALWLPEQQLAEGIGREQATA